MIQFIQWAIAWARWDWARSRISRKARRNGFTDKESIKIMKRRWEEQNPEPGLK